MSIPDPAIVETLERMMQAECGPRVVEAAEEEWPQALWRTVEEAGLASAWAPEASGGAGATLADGFAIVRTAARFAAPVPLAESLLAAYVLGQAKLCVPRGPLNAIAADLDVGADGKLSGEVDRVAFGRHLAALVVVLDAGAEAAIAVVPASEYRVSPETGLSGEACDRISFSASRPELLSPDVGVRAETVRRLGATLRCYQIAGALEDMLCRSLAYAHDRRQFGRPIAKFQAVQHNLARLAGESAAASAAANAAGSAFESYGSSGDKTLIAIAAAKVRCGQAASEGAAIAHQVHGAIGYAREYPLHLYTRRLWSWRDDYGAELEWAEALGRSMAAGGAESFWPTLTAI